MKSVFRQGVILLLALSSGLVAAATLQLPAPASTVASTESTQADPPQPELSVDQPLSELSQSNLIASLGKKPVKLSDYLPEGDPYAEYAASTARQPKLLVKYSHLTPGDVPQPLTPNWTSRYIQKNLPARVDINGIPQPVYTGAHQKILSLNDAILLALRNNPDVVSASLKRITDKYALEVSGEYPYQLQYGKLGFSSTLSKDGKPVYELTELPSLKLSTRYGTVATLTYGNTLTGTTGTSGNLEITQPLLKGLATANFAYYEAVDAELTARLGYFSTITGNVNTIITDYRALLETKMNISNDKENTKNDETALAQAKLKYKAGTASVNEVIQAASNLTTQQSTVIQDQLKGQTTYQQLLTDLGVSPASNFKILTDVQISPQDEKIPDLKTCIQITLSHNTDYLTQVLAMRATQRAVETARDARKWSLDLDLNHSFGVGTVPAGGSVANGNVPGSSAKLTLGFPIDYITLNQGSVGARIAYEDAKLQLLQTKEKTVAAVLTDYYAVMNGRVNLKLTNETLKQQTLTLEQNFLQYKYGKISALDYATARQNYISAQQSLVTAKITYLNVLTALRVEMDTLLQHYHIKLRY